MSVVGGSFGGSIKSAPGEIDRIVFLGAAPNLSAEKLKSRSLFIVARDDGNDSGLRLPGIRAQYDKGSSAEGTNRPGWFCARSVSFSNEPGYSGHARDPAIPIHAIVAYLPGQAQSGVKSSTRLWWSRDCLSARSSLVVSVRSRLLVTDACCEVAGKDNNNRRAETIDFPSIRAKTQCLWQGPRGV